MPTGPLIDSAATLTGALLGALTGHRFPQRLKTMLPLTFGILSMAMGIVMISKVSMLPAVILAVLVGSAIGELLKLESQVEKIAGNTNSYIQKIFPQKIRPENEEKFLKDFVSVLVLFSASGTGIFGAMNEGITNDTSVLVSKAFLDFFTAAIFAASLGLIVSVTVIPQLVILLTLYFLGGYILPFTTPELIADFSACGGIIMLATGFRICGIKSFPIVNLLPALVIVMYISHYWRVLF
ncbi:MAG: DUF554 domain-containing protein [Gemmatimonadaceae bacterium]|nr:DUF554 domain-containing protein [Chitinophagaceae bacterium]